MVIFTFDSLPLTAVCTGVISNCLISTLRGTFSLPYPPSKCKLSKLDVICEQNHIDNRFTKPSTPQTNGIVKRVNAMIKWEQV